MQNTPRALRPIPICDSVAAVSAGVTAWLTDIWGVMHNGVAPFEAAVAACEAFRAQGGTVILLSNAPRPAASVAAQLDKIGVRRSAWDKIISSGDATQALLSRMPKAPLFHLGPERDLPIYDGLDVDLGDEVTSRQVVCTGLFDDETETPADYTPMLTRFLAHGCPMICANPDLTVERGGKLVYCAGAIAAAYDDMGGPVTYAGKPYGPIYDMALAWLGANRGRAMEKAQVLAIGDGVRTDILGAARAGIASVYIASGVSMPKGSSLDAGTLASMFDDPAVQPVAAMAELAW
ncbi:MAG: TIGR01459 family HAD-type hydrolase [Hyphomicrobiaceae bacterium]|nr:TIGR01459 family HAD-type hydrolase [Hyphomicrobiaceae bacterium]